MDKLVSIITVVYNAESTIEQSILSVIGQKSRNYQYIIIDGNSTDQTTSIIHKYRGSIGFFSSEGDRGIYDAMNKGLNVIAGEYVLFLGADDFLYDSSVISDFETFVKNRRYDAVFGNVCYTSGTGIFPEFSSKILLHNTIHHQGAFYNRELFAHFRYDINLKLLSDYELNLELYLNRRRMNIGIIDRMISLCTENGMSRRMNNLVISETAKVRSKKISGVMAVIYQGLFIIKFNVWNAIRHYKL
ncbi:glycosyltransferase family 2 protein [Pedobacter sp. SYP-B3415]|uniref:glycosyltransferase family 2 protein n=1 Tax=Pedobacter sp. SYP-B3415 TaxID=2496641 RepID=UPI0013ECD30C|nr:glycosyltransferase family 2 protein [Pedobacter sp. SYP-B3415]